MLLYCRPHAGFLQFLREKLPALAIADPGRLLSFSRALAKVWLLDLNPAIPLLLSRYSRRGRPAEFEPLDLLRSLVLMHQQKVFGITKWVWILRHDRVLAVLSGFEPHKTPAVGTFYDFFHRCWLQDRSRIRARRRLLRPLKAKPRFKVKAGRKLTPKRPGIVSRLVIQALKRRSFQLRPERCSNRSLPAVWWTALLLSASSLIPWH